MRLFLDCEFTDFERPRLLSVGLVTDDGRELYLELSAAARPAPVSEFVEDHVLPQFDLVPSAVDSVESLGRRLGEWLLSLLGPDAEQLDISYDYHLDMDLVEDALRRAGLWAQLEPRLLSSNVGYMLEEQDAIDASELSWAVSFAADGIERHHGLADARALRAAFNAVHG